MSFFNSQNQKVRKKQQPKSNKQREKERETIIRKARRNRHPVWLIKGEI